MGPAFLGYRKASFAAASYNMVTVGNSIMSSDLSDMVTQIAALPPISGQLVINNQAASSQTIVDEINNPTNVDAAYVVGKVNIMLFWEQTNNVFLIGHGGAQTITDMQTYITARQAAVQSSHPGASPWFVILMTTLPRGDFFNGYFTTPITAGEVELTYINNYIRANYRAMGARAFVEARRTGGPFDFTDVSNAANFPALLWTDKTHPSNGANGGKAILAGYVADVLKRLPAR
ncbi:MAG: hypothetical protein JWR22_1316 [Herminiimonas sp.]|nr:hypothetical protein [Herminiimonas sp.]